MDKASRLMSDAVGSGTPIDGNECDESCEEIRSKLHDALEEKQKSKSRNFLRLSDSGPAEVQEGKPENWKGGCYLGKLFMFENIQLLFQKNSFHSVTVALVEKKRFGATKSSAQPARESIS